MQLRLEPRHLHEEPLEIPIQRCSGSEDFRSEQFRMVFEELLAGPAHLVGARCAPDLLPGSKEPGDDVDLLDGPLPPGAGRPTMGTGDSEREKQGES